jgi:hypothetical protein
MLIHTFECDDCGKKYELMKSEQTASPCCGKHLTKLEDMPLRMATDTPEQSRDDDLGGPYDDGRCG